MLYLHRSPLLAAVSVTWGRRGGAGGVHRLTLQRRSGTLNLFLLMTPLLNVRLFLYFKEIYYLNN